LTLTAGVASIGGATGTRRMFNMRSKKGKSPPARRVSWLDVDRRTRDYSFHDYMRIVAHARYVFRKVQRIIERRHARTSGRFCAIGAVRTA
jgi:hypothetical protein